MGTCNAPHTLAEPCQFSTGFRRAKLPQRPENALICGFSRGARRESLLVFAPFSQGGGVRFSDYLPREILLVGPAAALPEGVSVSTIGQHANERGPKFIVRVLRQKNHACFRDGRSGLPSFAGNHRKATGNPGERTSSARGDGTSRKKQDVAGAQLGRQFFGFQQSM